MKPEQKVVCLEMARRLKAAKFPQKTERSYYDWVDHPPEEHTDCHEVHWTLDYGSSSPISRSIAAPDAQEIGEVLPSCITRGGVNYFLTTVKDSYGDGRIEWRVDYSGINFEVGEPAETVYLGPTHQNACEVEARAEAWLYLKEQGLL